MTRGAKDAFSSSSARPPFPVQPGSGPKIYYILDNDEPTRGDSHGYTGLGRVMAQKLGGQFFRIDPEFLAQQYPEEDIWNRPECFLRDHGPADIIICRDRQNTIRFTNEKTIFIEGRNEFFGDLHNDDMLVSHHLNAEILAQEGTKFSSYYGDLSGDLIAVLLVEDLNTSGALGQSLVQDALKLGPSNIFITTCWRTPDCDYENVMYACRKEITAQKAEGVVRLFGHHLAEGDGGYNPYIGLLDRADHIILWGRSHSMFSEAAFTGKTVHLSLKGVCNPGYLPLVPRGIVRDYELKGEGLATSFYAPMNITSDIADDLIADIAYHLRKRGFLPPLSPGSYGPRP